MVNLLDQFAPLRNAGIKKSLEESRIAYENCKAYNAADTERNDVLNKSACRSRI